MVHRPKIFGIKIGIKGRKRDSSSGSLGSSRLQKKNATTTFTAPNTSASKEDVANHETTSVMTVDSVPSTPDRTPYVQQPQPQPKQRAKATPVVMEETAEDVNVAAAENKQDDTKPPQPPPAEEEEYASAEEEEEEEKEDAVAEIPPLTPTKNPPPVHEIDIDNNGGDFLSTGSGHNSEVTGLSSGDVVDKKETTHAEVNKETSKKMNDEEMSWNPNFTSTPSERKILYIQGDDSPPFRNYKKENAVRASLKIAMRASMPAAWKDADETSHSKTPRSPTAMRASMPASFFKDVEETFWTHKVSDTPTARSSLIIKGDTTPPFRDYKKEMAVVRASMPDWKDEETSQRTPRTPTGMRASMPASFFKDVDTGMRASMPASFFKDVEETSWTHKASDTPTARSSLIIKGDTTPPFRDYKKEMAAVRASMPVWKDEETSQRTPRTPTGMRASMPASFFKDVEETSWNHHHHHSETPTVRSSLKIAGDTTPAFRDYKKEMAAVRASMPALEERFHKSAGTTPKAMRASMPATFRDVEETSWNHHHHSDTPTVRSSLKIAGDTTPAFRDYKKETAVQRASMPALDEKSHKSAGTTPKAMRASMPATFKDAEETSWHYKREDTTPTARSSLVIQGDNTPAFRNYKKENAHRAANTFKARPLPNMNSPPSIAPTRVKGSGAARSKSSLPYGEDDSHSVSSARTGGKSVRSSVSRPSASAGGGGFKARPMPKFNEAPKVPVKQQRGPRKSDLTLSAK